MKLTISDYIPTHARTRAELSEFLFAQICDEQNGMTLSVVSALARLDFDPWSEAARLAGLPRSAAAATLAELIDRLFVGAAPIPDAASIASRLVKLLPDRATATAAAPTRHTPNSLPEQWSRVTLARICAILALAAVVAYFM